jgi:hypothetical protein
LARFDTAGVSRLMELGVEAVGNVVARYFGIDNLSRPNHAAIHGADSEKMMQHLEVIHDTATQIIEEVEVSELVSLSA